ncbi:MAG: hypothetical protein AAGF30_04030 [Pseudomonadota bacterium]
MTRILLLLCLLAVPVAAHHASDVLLRRVIVAEERDGTRVTIRLPLTLLFAQAAAGRAHTGTPVQAPLLIAEPEGAGWTYRIDATAPPMALAPLLAEALVVTADGAEARLQTVTLGPVDGTPLADAHISAIVVEAIYRGASGAVSVSFQVDDVAFPPSVHLETEVDDRRTGETAWSVGPLAEPIELPAPAADR